MVAKWLEFESRQLALLPQSNGRQSSILRGFLVEQNLNIPTIYHRAPPVARSRGGVRQRVLDALDDPRPPPRNGPAQARSRGQCRISPGRFPLDGGNGLLRY